MRKTIEGLIAEILTVSAQLSEAREYGSVRVYALFLADLTVSFASLLFDEAEPTPTELAYARALLFHPLLAPLDIKAELEAEFSGRY